MRERGRGDRGEGGGSVRGIRERGRGDSWSFNKTVAR